MKNIHRSHQPGLNFPRPALPALLIPGNSTLRHDTGMGGCHDVNELMGLSPQMAKDCGNDNYGTSLK